MSWVEARCPQQYEAKELLQEKHHFSPDSFQIMCNGEEYTWENMTGKNFSYSINLALTIHHKKQKCL